jgi:hypothetical protein
VTVNALHLSALSAIENGFSVIPTSPGTRIPFKDSNGWKDSTRDIDRIDRWWGRHPESNPAISTEDLVVVDLDLDEDGVFETIVKFQKLTGSWFTESTRTVRTPSGGCHLWFQRTDTFCLAGRMTMQGRVPYKGQWVDTPHIDIISQGPHVPYPESYSSSGDSFYTFVDPDAPIQPIPDWFWVKEPDPVKRPVRVMPVSTDAQVARAEGILDKLNHANKGERNSMLLWASGVFAEIVDDGALTVQQAIDHLTDTAHDIGLGRLETRATIRSGMRRR